MSRTIDVRNQRQVRFVEDKQVNAEYYTKAEIEPNEWFQGPRFPNLQLMFNRKNAYEEHGNEEKEKITSPAFVEQFVQVEEKAKSVGSEPKKYVKEVKHHNHGENIDMEAGDFIKRKHRALELDKMMSMKKM